MWVVILRSGTRQLLWHQNSSGNDLLFLSDPPHGLPKGPGGRQSHGHDGMSRACQHTSARVFPLGARCPSTTEERVQNTSRDCQGPIWQHQGHVWPWQCPTCNCQAILIKCYYRGEAWQQGQKMKIIEASNNVYCISWLAMHSLCPKELSCFELLNLMMSQKRLMYKDLESGYISCRAEGQRRRSSSNMTRQGCL